jgi:hypothetical protein
MAYMPFYSLLASSAFGFALLIAICIGEARRVKQHWLGCDGSFSHHEAAAPEDATTRVALGVRGELHSHPFSAGILRTLEIKGPLWNPHHNSGSWRPAAWIDSSSRFFMRSHHQA